VRCADTRWRSNRSTTAGRPPDGDPSPNRKTPSASLLAELHENEDFIRRTIRASLLPKTTPRGLMNMETPRLHEARPVSLESDVTTRSSFDSRFQRTTSWGSTVSSTTSTATEYSGYHNKQDTTRRPDIPSRAASWNGQQQKCASAPRYTYTPRPSTLMKPQRLAGQRHHRVSVSNNTPGEAFRKLPKEILDVVLVELRKLHLEVQDGTETCATCWMRDLCSLSQTNQKWARVAQFKLYEKIWLIGPDMTKRFKMKSGSRLKLLRRTLAANETMAGYVRELKVPDILTGTTTSLDQEKYSEMVSSVILSCPNLERLIGLYPGYNHSFSRITHALSTRTKLVEHVWNIQPGIQQGRSASIDRNKSEGHDARERLLPEQSSSFLSHHYNWTNLTTMVIHCQPGGVMDPQLLSRTFNYLPLPSLAHLSLSSLSQIPPDLLDSLPPLKSLNLSNLPSLTAHQLSTFATSVSAQTLTSLHLTHVHLTSLPVLARLLSKMTSLTHLSIKQDESPTLPIGTSIFLHPYLASSTLTNLTWDILLPNDEDRPHDASRVLAKAIRAGGFPALRVLKSPTDYEGMFQSLCKPIDRIISETGNGGTWKGVPTATLIDMIDSRRKDSGISVADDGSSYASHGSSYSRSLRVARQSAQARIDAAKLRPKFHIIAEDWSDCDKGSDFIRVTARFEIAGYFGTTGSQIRYSLEPDIEGADEVGMSVENLLVGEKGLEGSRIHVCDGRWNADMVNSRARKATGWQHRERIKWTPIGVDKLF
jgi:hypothetical protein